MPDTPTDSTGNILDIRFDLITCQSVMDKIDGWRRKQERRYIAIANPHSVMCCHRDRQMARAIEDADLVLPDGIGIVLAASLLGYPHHGRVTGPSLMLQVCDWGRKQRYRHFFCGGAEGVAVRLAARLGAMYPGLEVAGTFCPPFRPPSAADDQEIVDRINATSPDIVWIGLGAPKQENWMVEHVGRIRAAAMIGVGAAFDFHCGSANWAPLWVRRLGFEWAYRLASEPTRLWKRNMDSPLFLLKVVGQRIAQLYHSFRPLPHEPEHPRRQILQHDRHEETPPNKAA